MQFHIKDIASLSFNRLLSTCGILSNKKPLQGYKEILPQPTAKVVEIETSLALKLKGLHGNLSPCDSRPVPGWRGQPRRNMVQRWHLDKRFPLEARGLTRGEGEGRLRLKQQALDARDGGLRPSLVSCRPRAKHRSSRCTYTV